MAPPAAAWAPEARAIRRWKVLHACGYAADVNAVVDAQFAAGMRPWVTDRASWANASRRGPLGAWNDVKRWRTELAGAQASHCDLVHAHEFASGMAALRSGYAVVYDFSAPVEETGDSQPGAWLRRSMRVAEQFLMARAGAVVVHCNALWDAALERGVSAQDLFLVPDPVESAWEFAANTRSRTVTVAAPRVANGSDFAALLDAFLFVREEVDNARLLIGAAADSKDWEARIAAAGLTESVTIGGADVQPSIASADLVITFAADERGPDAVMLAAMAHGCAVLACDRPAAREINPDGRGCLWFRPGDTRDLGHRAAFLARNADFRTSLGAAAKAHIAATRSPAVVAKRYDAVYRHAYQRQPSSGDFLPSSLRMAQCCV